MHECVSIKDKTLDCKISELAAAANWLVHSKSDDVFILKPFSVLSTITVNGL